MGAPAERDRGLPLPPPHEETPNAGWAGSYSKGCGVGDVRGNLGNLVAGQSSFALEFTDDSGVSPSC